MRWYKINLMKQNDYLPRATDLIAQAQSGRRIYTDFLTPLEQSTLIAALSKSGIDHDASGGHYNAERRMFRLGERQSWDDDKFPIYTLKIVFYKQELKYLTHRNVLGALLALGQNRSMIGDILIGDMCAYVFVLSHKSEYILANLTDIGRAHVSVSIAISDIDYAHPAGTIRKSTLASLRLDSVLALGLSISRQKASELVKSEVVFIDHVLQSKPGKEVSQGSVISVRKHGRIVLREVSSKSSKKNRTWVELECFL
ncbi:MAG: hypothetical protein HN948_02785 [Clostridia bacterium]|nr:hypothetical protein [Clostridia bacterium]MBT7121917.1 hypothetical protein [Clostridia bacterium]